jgi:transposase
MWTTKNRGRYDRSQLRYPSDLTDDEWACRPLYLAGQARRQQASRRCARGDERDHVRLKHGMPWRAIPKDLPPRSTLFHYLDLWS